MLKADVFDAADSKGLAYVTMACLGRFYLIIRDAATRPRRSVNPNESLSAKFTAPAQNSRYRYVCVCVCATTVLFSALVHWPALWGSGGLRWNKRERERERKRRERDNGASSSSDGVKAESTNLEHLPRKEREEGVGLWSWARAHTNMCLHVCVHRAAVQDRLTHSTSFYHLYTTIWG
jgi:hypothetical protein